MVTSLLFWSCENKVEKPTAIKENSKVDRNKGSLGFYKQRFQRQQCQTFK